MGNSPRGCKDIGLKTIYLCVQDQIISISCSSLNTSEWLLNHTRSITKLPNIISLETRFSEMSDYSLTIPEKSLSFLDNKDTIYPVYSKISGLEKSLHSFSPLKIIGKGGFSTVYLVRHKETGKMFAVKTMQKLHLAKENKISQIVLEKDILQNSNHPFIVKLFMALQSRTKAHLIMEFCPGGELFFHLQKLKKLDENDALFYFAEILLALEYIHKSDIIYRDLKPENILLDVDGHIKLIDFGLAKQGLGKEGVTFSFCGSPEYMSPEVLNGVSHGRAVDYYGLGALLFEMLTGMPPFYDRNPSQMEWNIKNLALEIPKELSKSSKDIIKKLLNKEPEKRLGFNKGIEEIKAHSWCRSVNWKKLMNKDIKPPFIPHMRESNFDQNFTREQLNSSCLLDEDDDNNAQSVFIDNFDYVQEHRKRKKKILSIIPEVQESIADLSTKNSEEKQVKVVEFTEESCGYSNSVESEGSIQINEIPSFTTRFFE